jgi:hypothetical protein
MIISEHFLSSKQKCCENVVVNEAMGENFVAPLGPPVPSGVLEVAVTCQRCSRRTETPQMDGIELTSSTSSK